MTHIALTQLTFQALAMCMNRIIAAVLIPAGSGVRALADPNMGKVSWLVLRFNDGSELQLWPDAMCTPTESREFDMESFVLCAEHRAENGLGRSQSFVEASALQPHFLNRQIRDIRVCGALDLVDGALFRVDEAIQMTLDENSVELITNSQRVIPMSLGIRLIRPEQAGAFQP